LSLVFLGAAYVLRFYAAFVFMELWGWYLVPTFEVQELPYVVAVGMTLMATTLNRSMGSKDTQDPAWVLTSLAAMFISVTLTWALGGFLTLFM